MAARRPPAMHCRECGRDMGRGWASAPLCADCADDGNEDRRECLCVQGDPNWKPNVCEVHPDHDPYDIPF